MKDDSVFDLRLPAEMAKVAEQAGLRKINKKKEICFSLAVLAGVFISIGFTFYITVTTGVNSANALTRVAGGVGFSLGLILVVVCGADLFTSTVLTTIAKASRLVTWRQLMLNWVIVYLGNMVGAILFVLLIWFSGLIMNSGGLWGLNVLLTADHKLHHTFIEAVCLGVLCNLMVCLAVWLSYSGRSLTDKVMSIILPISMFVASGFEHSIANMFLVPLALLIRHFAPESFWNTIHHSPGDFPSLTMGHFIADNLLPVTIGNIIGGGVLVGMTYWALYLRHSNNFA